MRMLSGYELVSGASNREEMHRVARVLLEATAKA
jgi:hypothetical protein